MTEPLINGLAGLLVVSAVVFITYHVGILFLPGYSLAEKLVAIGLLISEVFFATSGIGYAFWVLRSRDYRSARNHWFSGPSDASVACLIPMKDEPREVLEKTVAAVCGQWYENKTVYLLDDSTSESGQRTVNELAETYSVNLIRRPTRAHFKAGNINHALRKISEEFIAVFDADQRPEPGFLADIVPLLEADPGLAFIQTPQEYDNTWSMIAMAACMQNGLFYEHIAEGKDVNNAMFCCGTNFIMRRSAIVDVGGFDVRSLTEDFATTLKLHSRGWRTRFYDTHYVAGLGPESLTAYLKQYSRWATGTLQVLKMKLKLLAKNPRALTPHQWFEYWLSCSYYLSGPINFFLLILPPVYLLTGLNPIKGPVYLYLTLFTIVLGAYWTLFLASSYVRGYPLRELVTVCARLETCKFYVYTQALINVALGRRLTFTVTEKGASSQIPWRFLSVPLTVLSLNAVAAGLGLVRLSGAWTWYTVITTFWAGYNVWMLSALIQYNTATGSRQVETFVPWAPSAGLDDVAVSGDR